MGNVRSTVGGDGVVSGDGSAAIGGPPPHPATADNDNMQLNDPVLYFVKLYWVGKGQNWPRHGSRLYWEGGGGRA